MVWGWVTQTKARGAPNAGKLSEQLSKQKADGGHRDDAIRDGGSKGELPVVSGSPPCLESTGQAIHVQR